MNANQIKPLAGAVVVALSVSGCGLMPALDEVAPDNTQRYRTADTMPPLDVPPDLSVNRINDDIAAKQESAATYSEYEESSSNPLAMRYNIEPDQKPKLRGEDDDRRLVVTGNMDLIWQRVTGFWRSKELQIDREDKRLGLMDTTPDSQGYAYRTRISRDDENTMVIHVSGKDESNQTKDQDILRQMADYLGVLHQEDVKMAEAQQEEQTSMRAREASQSQTPRAILMDEDNGHQALLVEQDFRQVWDRVGRVLDSKGFDVEDRDRSAGTYYVRYLDPFNEIDEDEEGFFSGLAFWRDDDEVDPEEFYFIRLMSDGGNTRIGVLDADEERTSSDTARRLLGLLQEQLSL